MTLDLSQSGTWALGTMVVAAPVCRPGKHLTMAAFEDQGMPWASWAGSLFPKVGVLDL